MMALDSLVLTVVFAAVFFYVLYGVIRVAVREGILQADEQRQKARVGVNSGGEGA
ncbi:hypothetical protein [Arthrobacter sp. OV608]|uniref:hypothetical protein n=1 Tax=Arthrobacter sp. OV608 TaxID=1882768 RepID=UPI0008BE2885|nr:hypothetical protein [Arthrobacter sp. OV608]SEQ59498.1 hypothetical protein SAMN05444745_10831 [Arthrobacter sp. OV608]